ncbi:hypothetical protein OEB99_12415 [Actinotalea sp. M2MS4P-6]|uniref:hypothetical protein n=1 Tax=Actinotalea sp. M2MS4P-6 TaxID=2983762 RepID=UPI0021E4016F|nr:hypothetical protein [Actinotalea sp. M2MS4P-6]MCV2395112.1 hypothetical protein [Actinotalea sp. M2MS4P-6]
MSVERVDVLLSAQRALWEQVTPNLRGVAVALHSLPGDQAVSARFLYDGGIGEVERECVSLAETHCIADFGPDVAIRFTAVEEAARELVGDEEWIYLRHETDPAERARPGAGDPPEVVDNPFPWSFVLSVIEDRLGMWVGRPTYERAVALVIGFDMAQPESIGGSMQRRVSERLGSGSRGWPWVLMDEAIGESPSRGRDLSELTAEQDSLAIAHLVSELRALLGARAD